MYYLHVGDKTDRYTDPQEAGKAFYKAGLDKQPSVTIKNGAEKITLADTLIHHKNDKHRIKRIRESASKEKGFLSGYYGELESSLSSRLKAVKWEEARPEQPDQAPNIDESIQEDLAALAKRDRQRAAQLWAEHAPAEYMAPAMVDPKYQKEMDKLKEASSALENAEIREPAIVMRDVEKEEEKEETDKETNFVKSLDAGADFAKYSPILPEKIKKRYILVNGKFYYHDQPKQVAIKDTGKYLKARLDSTRIAEDIVEISNAKGWKELEVSGSETFRREIWVEASARGMAVKGYRPKDKDRALLEKKLRERGVGEVEADRMADNAATRSGTTTKEQIVEDDSITPEQRKKAEAVRKDSAWELTKKGMYSAAALVAISKARSRLLNSRAEQDLFEKKARDTLAKKIERGEELPQPQVRRFMSTERDTKTAEQSR